MPAFIVIGTIVDATDDWKLRIHEDCLMVIDRSGKIVKKCDNNVENLRDAKERYSCENEDIIVLDKTDEFLLPGLIDSHIHAAQFPNAGLGLDMPLLDWLQKYTFPLEKSLGDPNLANRVYESAVSCTLNSGTTCASYYGTIHRQSTEVLCDVAEANGQRALVGKVCMNRNGNGYQETTSDSLNDTNLFVSATLQRNSKLVLPIVTPRFAPSCDEELLMGLGDIANKYNVRIQSHLSESVNEVKWVSELFPSSKHYTGVYKDMGLLNDKTIMAHGVHLKSEELKMLEDVGAGISHCPNSNCSLKSGFCNVLRLKDHGVKVGLGTDCAGGYSPSMIDSMRFAIGTSNNLYYLNNCENDNEKSTYFKDGPLTYEGALFLATRGSANVCSLQNVTGGFDVGLQFDALRIKMSGAKEETNLFGYESVRDMIQKFVFVGDDRNVIQVYVNGKLVKDILNNNQAAQK